MHRCWDGAIPTLEITDLDDDLVRRLDARARLRGVWLDAFVRETLTAAAPLGSSGKTALIADFQRRCGPIRLDPPPEEVVRAARDNRQRGHAMPVLPGDPYLAYLDSHRSDWATPAGEGGVRRVVSGVA